jgi:hypothetical protein
MRRALALLALVPAACASAWTVASVEESPALAPDARIAVLTRDRGAERRMAIRVGERDVDVRSVDDLMSHARPIDSPEAAIAYSDLVRRVRVEDSGAKGIALRPDAALAGAGGSGRYSRSDAAAWGVEFLPSARPFAGGFEVTHLVLLPPAPHPVLRGASPWRLVLMREVVLPDGRLRAVEEKTLTNGNDAARYADL